MATFLCVFEVRRQEDLTWLDGLLGALTLKNAHGHHMFWGVTERMPEAVLEGIRCGGP
jgi:hypothetical protein